MDNISSIFHCQQDTNAIAQGRIKLNKGPTHCKNKIINNSNAESSLAVTEKIRLQVMRRKWKSADILLRFFRAREDIRIEEVHEALLEEVKMAPEKILKVYAKVFLEYDKASIENHIFLAVDYEMYHRDRLNRKI